MLLDFYRNTIALITYLLNNIIGEKNMKSIDNKSKWIKTIGIGLSILGLLSLYPVPGSASPDTNLIANPGFEDGAAAPMNWKIVTNNGNTPIWDTLSHNGGKSIKISAPGPYDTISGQPQSDLIQSGPLQHYIFSAWIKTENIGGSNEPMVRIVELDANREWINQTNLPHPDINTNDWAQTTVEFQTGHKTKYLYVYANIWNGYGTFWVDDVELKSSSNLIANPGFENGVTVPLNWTFETINGNTPIWDDISNNGSKAIKISIPGKTDVISGFPKSDLVNAEPAQYYTFSAWGKTEGAGGTNMPAVRIVELDAMKNWLGETNIPPFERGTNDWTQKNVEFKTLSNTAYLYVYANIWNGYGTFWVDDLELNLKRDMSSTADVTSKSEPSIKAVASLSTNDPPINGGAITINQDKTISIKGKKRFPVYMYGICSAHYELEGYVNDCNPSENSEFMLDGGGEYAGGLLLTNAKKKFEDAKMYYSIVGYGAENTIPKDLINSPYFFGYWQKDEPTESNLQDIIDSYNELKSMDPAHPVVLNHWKDMVKWSPYADIITWDMYTIRNTNDWPREDSIYAYEVWSQDAFFKGTNINSLGKPVWAVIQANGVPEGNRVVPTTKEARANTYTAITMDVKGIGFWSYKGMGGSLTPTAAFPKGTTGLYNKPELHSYYRQLAKELNSLNDILVLPTKDYSWEYYEGKDVSFSKNLKKTVLWGSRTNFNYILKQDGDTSYLIVVNKDSRPISDVGITIGGLTGAKTATTLGLETGGSSKAGKTLSVNNGKFTDSFDGYAVHIYQVS